MMEEIKIEKNVPILTRKKYPWNKMEEGDSFFVGDCDTNGRQSIQNTGNGFYKTRDINLKVATRKESNGYRFWTIKKP